MPNTCAQKFPFAHNNSEVTPTRDAIILRYPSPPNMKNDATIAITDTHQIVRSNFVKYSILKAFQLWQYIACSSIDIIPLFSCQ